jgi:TetR/AcrR family transcriptional regulator
LLLENERLQVRMNLFFDKIEAALKQCLRDDIGAQDVILSTQHAQVRATVLVSFARGRLQRYVRSHFKRLASEQLEHCLTLML